MATTEEKVLIRINLDIAALKNQLVEIKRDFNSASASVKELKQHIADAGNVTKLIRDFDKLTAATAALSPTSKTYITNLVKIEDLTKRINRASLDKENIGQITAQLVTEET